MIGTINELLSILFPVLFLNNLLIDSKHIYAICRLLMAEFPSAAKKKFSILIPPTEEANQKKPAWTDDTGTIFVP